ncbi:hypothetical protein EW026_g6532 [Hermanssonia centrifuga]|uniref:Uncharacterized protein n=1 Tax=Hermanssonia centrifuga TaxID=98765 RepID=A0A4V3X9Q5_9APHY|nr:hypothetical protein EW026_g6532 [Hermanssonia centrifuga]
MPLLNTYGYAHYIHIFLLTQFLAARLNGGGQMFGKWYIQLLDNGKYTLKIGGALATEIDSEVYAVYLEQIRLPEWVITPTPQHGPHVYIIEKGDRSAGWVLPEKEPLTQVAVKPLVAGLSFPPFYLTSERFEIIPIDSE